MRGRLSIVRMTKCSSFNAKSPDINSAPRTPPSETNPPKPLSWFFLRLRKRGTPPYMIAEIIAAGSEMLTPHRQDTNSLFLTEALNDLGVQVAFKTIVGDNLAHLTSAAATALSRADIVLFSPRLGPTEDDLTP